LRAKVQALQQQVHDLQVCWAHLSRDFQAMVDRANAGSQIGEELLCCAQDLFTWWYRVRDGTLKRSTFRQYMGIVRSMVREQLQAGTACGCGRSRKVYATVSVSGARTPNGAAVVTGRGVVSGIYRIPSTPIVARQRQPGQGCRHPLPSGRRMPRWAILAPAPFPSPAWQNTPDPAVSPVVVRPSDR
jgi:transposase